MAPIRELRKSQRRTSSLYDTWFTRRVSIYLTAALLPLGVSPNGVSILNLFVGLGGWLLIALDVLPLLGVVLIHLYAVMDSVDGEIARHRKRFSLQGMFLEDYSAYLMISGYWLSMGTVLSRSFETLWPLGLAGALVAFGRSAMPVARRVLLAALTSERWVGRGAEEGGSSPTQLSGLTALVFESVLHPSHVWAVSTLVFAVERILGLGHAALAVVVSFYFILYLVKEAAVVLRMGLGSTLGAELRRIEAAHDRARGPGGPGGSG